MKVAYLSYSWFADADFSIIREMKTKTDLYYFIIITPSSLKSTAINIRKQHAVPGIFKVDIYPEIKRFSEFIDTEKTYIVNICSDKANFENFAVFFKLVFILMRMNIDILHTTMYYLWRPMFPLFFFREKTVLTVHDPLPHPDTWKSERDSIYRKITFKVIKNFVILNESQKNGFVSEYKLKNKNIHISRLGIYDYLRKYIKAAPAQNNIKKEYILFFGRITEYKGLEFLFSAMKIVNEKYKDVKLIAAGYCEKYYFDISEYEKCSYIEIMNRFIPDDELAELIQKSLFVVCPYIDATQSGAVMSAFAFNVPVLATNTGGLPDYVEHMKSGYIVEPKDVNGLADGIDFLLSNKELLGEQRRYIENRYGNGDYSWNKITDDLIAFYGKSVYGGQGDKVK
jgi:glycosyltransferase involved in cell wall biosynthesis